MRQPEKIVVLTPDEYRLIDHISMLRRKDKRVVIEVVNTTDDIVETFVFG
jgi:hypothetical protein